MKYGSEDPSLLLSLLQVTSVAMDSLSTRLAHLKLSPAELSVLANLADGQPRRVGMLARAIGVRPSTLTGILDRLARRELITRVPHPRDRRSIMAELTPAGRRAAEQVAAAYRELEERAMAHLNTQSVSGYHAVLRALRRVS